MAWAFLRALLGNWKQFLVVMLVLLGVSVWLRFQFMEAQANRLKEALDREHTLRLTAENRLALSERASEEAAHTERVNTVTRIIEHDVEREITDAVQRQDAHALYVAWRAGVERLRNDELGTATS